MVEGQPGQDGGASGGGDRESATARAALAGDVERAGHGGRALLGETQEMYPQVGACNFDKAFHRAATRNGLEDFPGMSALPNTGQLTKADRKREGKPELESPINYLKQRCLSQVWSGGRTTSSG